MLKVLGEGPVLKVLHQLEGYHDEWVLGAGPNVKLLVHGHFEMDSLAE